MLEKIETFARHALGIDPDSLTRLETFRSVYTQIRNRFLTPRWVAHPSNIQIDTHNYCNLWMGKGKGCVHCNVKPSGGWDIPRGRMPLKMIKQIIEYWGSHGARSIAPYVNGEPMLDDRLTQILNLAQQNGLVSFIDTNGTLYDFRHRIAHKNAIQVRFSLSAHTKETYELVQGKDLFKDAKKTVNWFLKNRKPNQYPMLYFITNKYNEHELRNYLKEWFGKIHIVIFPIHEVGEFQAESQKTRPSARDYWTKITTEITGKPPHQPFRPIDVFPDGKRRTRHFKYYETCQGTYCFSVAWTGELIHCTDLPYKFNYGHIDEIAPLEMLDIWSMRNIFKINHPACRFCNVRHPDHDKILRKYLKCPE